MPQEVYPLALLGMYTMVLRDSTPENFSRVARPTSLSPLLAPPVTIPIALAPATFSDTSFLAGDKPAPSQNVGGQHDSSTIDSNTDLPGLTAEQVKITKKWSSDMTGSPTIEESFLPV
ncbi:hypothetical protein FRB95_006900 [Tulasnella sp. JGI-2019a]|nr:hypothetical protein FRB95_006900 [Tulasnella sp. JGI-2019a]